MTEAVLDCKGLECPKPVLECKDCIEKDAPGSMRIVVDNEAARENVARFLAAKGYRTESEVDGDFWIVKGSRTAAADSPAPDPAIDCPTVVPAERKILVFLSADTIGKGDDELGGKLMVNYLDTLKELGTSLWRIVMVNSGVKLATAASPALPKLRALAEAGVSILVCGTCLTHFGLMDDKAVGETTNMLDIVTSQHLADKVVSV